MKTKSLSIKKQLWNPEPTPGGPGLPPGVHPVAGAGFPSTVNGVGLVPAERPRGKGRTGSCPCRGGAPEPRRAQRCSASVRLFLPALLISLLAGLPAHAQRQDEAKVEEVGLDPISFRPPDPVDQFEEIYIEQKLDAPVPLDLVFTDEEGKEVTLGSFFNDKPVVLSLVYYECPMLCTLILTGMVSGFDGSDNTLNIGEDYEVVTISVDPDETPEMAREKKAAYLKQYHRDGGAEGWHFLTGKEDAIEDLAQSVGFRYYYDKETDQFAHASGIMILTPGGRVSSYYLGIEYLPRNLKLAIMDAADGRIGSLVEQLILLCYAYDPAKGTYGFYVLNAVRLGGGLVVGAIVLFWTLAWAAGRRKKHRPPVAGKENHPEIPAHH